MAPPLAATGKAGKDAHSEETSSLGARAFGVLANYVAAEVADENERLGRMSPVVDFLDRVELRFDGGSIGFEGLGGSERLEHDRGLYELVIVRVSDDDGGARSMPLAGLCAGGGTRLYISVQSRGICASARC